MRAGGIVLVVLACSSVCFGQLSAEEAYQKLQEKQRQQRAAVAASQPASPATHPTQAARGKLLHDGWTALMGHRYAVAVPIFDKAVLLNSKDSVALQGRGICRYQLKQYKQADKDVEQAYGFAGKGSSSGTPRQLLIALAATSSMNDNPMRAVRLLRGTMESLEQESKLDEQLQNFLGIALSKTSPQARKQPYFQESLKYYMEYDQKLAQEKKDSTARWGTQWIELGTAEKKWTAYQTAAAEVDQAASAHDHSLLALDQAKELMIELHGLRLHSDEERIRWTNQYKQAIAGEAGAKNRLAKAVDRLSKVEKPPFPDRIEYDWKEPQ
jgi:hypothetical protein